MKKNNIEISNINLKVTHEFNLKQKYIFLSILERQMVLMGNNRLNIWKERRRKIQISIKKSITKIPYYL